jgi:hypothetical protein
MLKYPFLDILTVTDIIINIIILYIVHGTHLCFK